MKTELGAEQADRQQQQGDGTNLEARYRAIGIPAVSAAAALCKPKKKPSTFALQQQAMLVIEPKD